MGPCNMLTVGPLQYLHIIVSKRSDQVKTLFQMFNHVLTIERDVLWTYGGVVCAAYPLQYIDTIEQQSGELNELSALSLIVHGVSALA